MSKRRVVITGIGAVDPYWASQPRRAGKQCARGCGIGPITQYDPTGLKVQLAAEVKDFQPETVLDRQAAKRMGRFTQFAMVASPAGHGKQWSGPGAGGPGPLRRHHFQRHWWHCHYRGRA